MSTEVKEETFKLSNRGNKLTGKENPGAFRPKIWWKNKWATSNLDGNEDDFEVFEGLFWFLTHFSLLVFPKTYEKMFMRKIKFNSQGNFDEETSVPFVRFLNEFDAQRSLFIKEGIDLDSKHESCLNYSSS